MLNNRIIRLENKINRLNVKIEKVLNYVNENRYNCNTNINKIKVILEEYI